MNIEKIAILGAGNWGTALAWLWAQNNRPIILWGHHAGRMERIQSTRENANYLPGVKLPDSLRAVSDLRECADADLIVFVTPSTALRDTAAKLRDAGRSNRAILLSCTKGIEAGTGLRMTEILAEIFPQNDRAVLSGPNLASEVAEQRPTATVIGCGNPVAAAALQNALGSPRFRVYTSDEVTGIELGGALKNVYALAAGICDGLGLGENAKAALVTRALAELVRLGLAMGGNVHAFYGLSGVGDLIVTCYSEESRNHTVGRRLGEGESLADVAASMNMIAEGVTTSRSAHECARRLNVDTPIIDQVYAMLYQGKKPTVALQELLGREQKSERA